jgi:hypothetical protein
MQSGRKAKEFVISRILAEAQRENVVLSEVERKMLYFSETGWTIPNILAVNEEFEREYDSDQYEQKIADLARKAGEHAREESREEYEAWRAAIRFLESEDHYISVMLGMRGICSGGDQLRPAGDHWKLLGAGLGVVACIALAVFVVNKFQIDVSEYLPTHGGEGEKSGAGDGI